MAGKVKTNLNGTSIEKFIMMSEAYIKSLMKPVFEDVTPTIVDISPKLEKLKSLQAEVKEGSHKAVAMRNILRKEINSDLRRMCEWVNIHAHGNIEMLNQCAFEKVKARSASPIPAGIRKLMVYRSNETGKALVSWKGNGAKFYRTQMTVNPNIPDEWKDVATVTSNRCELAGLPVGMFCYFRVQGVNATGAGEYSEVYMYMAS